MRASRRIYISALQQRGAYKITTPTGHALVGLTSTPLPALVQVLQFDGEPGDTPLEIYWLGKEDPTPPAFVTLESLAGTLAAETPAALATIADDVEELGRPTAGRRTAQPRRGE